MTVSKPWESGRIKSIRITSNFSSVRYLIPSFSFLTWVILTLEAEAFCNLSEIILASKRLSSISNIFIT